MPEVTIIDITIPESIDWTEDVITTLDRDELEWLYW